LYASGDISISGLAPAILQFRLPLTRDSIRKSATELLDPENMEVAVGILFTGVIEAELCLGHLVYEPTREHYRIGSHHIGFLGGTGAVQNVPFCSPIMFRKSHKGITINSVWFRNASEKIGLGVILPHLAMRN
jgi:hypothetical protein